MGSIYVFVDGGHLRRHYAETMMKWSKTAGELFVPHLMGNIGVNKCFWYDCLDDVRGDNESDSDYKSRIAVQKERLSVIRRAQNTHVRLGSMSGKGKRKRQKEVDILLAVEAMGHAARGNMTQAVLVTGDKDFKPLVENLVNMGLTVQVVGDHRHTARDLADAADHFRPLRLTDYVIWSSNRVRQVNQLPSKSVGYSEYPASGLRQKGTIGGKDAEIYEHGTDFIAKFAFEESFMHISYKDIERLRQFCEIEFGEVLMS